MEEMGYVCKPQTDDEKKLVGTKLILDKYTVAGSIIQKLVLYYVATVKEDATQQALIREEYQRGEIKEMPLEDAYDSASEKCLTEAADVAILQHAVKTILGPFTEEFLSTQFIFGAGCITLQRNKTGESRTWSSASLVNVTLDKMAKEC